MNILYICDEYPPGFNGGIGSITQVLGRTLVAQGHNVYVAGLYTHEYGGKDYEEDNGVHIWRLRYGFRFPEIKLLYSAQRRLPGPLKTFLYSKRAFRRYTAFIKNLIEEKKIDIVEQPDWITYGYETGLKKPVFPPLPVPLVLKFHGSHTYSCHELSRTPIPHFTAVDKAIFERADALVAVSMHAAKVNKKMFGGNKEVAVLYNAIEVPEKPEAENRSANMVFYSGTLVETKGAYSLIKAWNIVAAKHQTAQLILFGKGPTEPLIQLLDKAVLKTVTFMGHRPRAMLMEYLQQATLAIFPSYTEAFSLAPLESMSRGCATIFTRRSSGREVIQNEVTGLLVEPDNIEEIAEKIVYLLDHKDIREQMGIAGRNEVLQRFEISHSARMHIEYYESVIRAFHKTGH